MKIFCNRIIQQYNNVIFSKHITLIFVFISFLFLLLFPVNHISNVIYERITSSTAQKRNCFQNALRNNSRNSFSNFPPFCFFRLCYSTRFRFPCIRSFIRPLQCCILIHQYFFMVSFFSRIGFFPTDITRFGQPAVVTAHQKLKVEQSVKPNRQKQDDR